MPQAERLELELELELEVELELELELELLVLRQRQPTGQRHPVDARWVVWRQSPISTSLRCQRMESRAECRGLRMRCCPRRSEQGALEQGVLEQGQHEPVPRLHPEFPMGLQAGPLVAADAGQACQRSRRTC